MRNKWYRYFWTELGRRVAGTSTEFSAPPAYFPDEMTAVLNSDLPESGKFSFHPGTKLPPWKSKYIYGYTWKILREWGFSRSLRLSPWPGVSMFIPFYRNNTGVIPQSFSRRIPPEKRAFALVGKSAAAHNMDINLWIVPANWSDEVLSIFKNGGVKVCSLDNLTDICEKGFQ